MNDFTIILPHVFGAPQRILIINKEELVRFIVCNEGVNPIFYQINNPPFIDKVFFDFDNEERALIEIRKLDDYLKVDNIRRVLLFSGRGFHLYILPNLYNANDMKKVLAELQKRIIRESNTKPDSAVVGDIRRLGRMPNSKNQKSGLYCIYLSSEQLHSLTFSQIQELAKQKSKKVIEGQLELDLSIYDSREKVDYSLPEHVNGIKINGFRKLEEKEFNALLDILPVCMKSFVINYHPQKCWRQRGAIINYLKSIGVETDDIANFFYSFLDEEKFKHSFYTEKQFQYLSDSAYESTACGTLMKDFICTSCNFYPYPAKRLVEMLKS